MKSKTLNNYGIINFTRTIALNDMHDKDIFITNEKKSELQHELEELKTVKRPDILKRLEAARSLGDLKENAEYHTMRDLQGKNEARIREVEHILNFAKIVEKNSDGSIGLGSKVTVQKKGGDANREFIIVGPAEADIAQGKISSESLIGAALLNKKAGDIADVETKKGTTQYTIISVE